MTTHHSHDLPFGATALDDGRTRFRLWAPSVDAVSLLLDDAPPEPMRGEGGGWFSLTRPASAGARYAFRMPDGLTVPDPASRRQADDVHGPSLLTDPRGYAWRNTGWSNRPWHEAVILELHPGLAGGFAGIERALPAIAEAGITAIELMPLNDFPGPRNWGYDGVLPFAPDTAYGTPDELKSLIDAAHGNGLMVMLDVVYNHFGPDGAYLHAYATSFFDEGVHTPWGAAIDFKKPEVREFFLHNALMWLNEYRFDGLRFDATHAIAPQDALPALARAIREGADHAVHLVLEHEGNRSSLLRPAADGGNYDAQWADDFHHCLHVLLTGEHEGYYEDFSSRPAEQLARALSDGFVFQGERSPHLDRARGEPTDGLPTTAFVFCLQNHDQIGNRAMGERLAALAHPDAMRAATALLLLSPMIPLLFMGDEYGSRTPFLFFTSHNDELAPLVRDGRRREFQHFAAFADETRRAAIPDPNAVDTYERSRPDEAERAAPANAAILAWHRELLALRAARVAPFIPGTVSLGAEAIDHAAVRASWRLGNGDVLTLVCNLGEHPVSLVRPRGALIIRSSDAGDDTIVAARTTLSFLERADG